MAQAQRNTAQRAAPLIWGVPGRHDATTVCKVRLNTSDCPDYSGPGSRGSGHVVQERDAPCWKFADAQFDSRSLELTVAGEIVELERKPLEVLRLLLQRAGEVIGHEELLDTIWPGRIVSESVLKKCVSRLREVLRDDDHAIVKTVHGYGYRLVAPVEVLATKSTVLLSPQFSLSSGAGTRYCTVLIVDIAGTVGLRSRIGDAAAGRRIRHLLDQIIAAARHNGGDFIKSYGDDVMAVFERDGASSAARTAVAAQRLAADASLQLYAGFHPGQVEFAETMGHPDALGLTVNFAARLHKLTEGAPGHIFLAEEAVAALAPELRALASRYGPRELKGIGKVQVWTLDWEEATTTTETVLCTDAASSVRAAALLLRHGDSAVRLEPAQGSGFVGRGSDCALRLIDPESRISSTHLMFEHCAGHWFAQDVSRNGTWLRDGRTGEETLLPYCTKAMLPAAGVLCLGRAFKDDAEGRYTVSFEFCSEAELVAR
jgi:adenylate cyclase